MNIPQSLTISLPSDFQFLTTVWYLATIAIRKCIRYKTYDNHKSALNIENDKNDTEINGKK